MKIFSIFGWQTGEPHWYAAFVEAETAEEAKDILEKVDMGERFEVWAVEPRKDWEAVEVERPFLFVLGSGCR